MGKKEDVEFIIVYDFGGGTLDVSILRVSEDGHVEVIGSGGDDRLGGVDFDAAAVHYLLNHMDGKAVIHGVTDAIQNIRDISFNYVISHNFDNELNKHILSQCSKLPSIPLCTLSSLHVIVEQMKIELSAHPHGGGTSEKECLG